VRGDPVVTGPPDAPPVAVGANVTLTVHEPVGLETVTVWARPIR
jgi:hypothetical protein